MKSHLDYRMIKAKLGDEPALSYFGKLGTHVSGPKDVGYSCLGADTQAWDEVGPTSISVFGKFDDLEKPENRIKGVAGRACYCWASLVAGTEAYIPRILCHPIRSLLQEEISGKPNHVNCRRAGRCMEQPIRFSTQSR